MADFVTAHFTDKGVPKTGLSPTVSIWRVSDAVPVLTAGAMTEVAGGHYRRDITSLDKTKNYVALADGGVSLTDHERFKPAAFDLELPIILGHTTDLNDELFGKWTLDPNTNVLSLFRINGSLLKSFDMTTTGLTVQPFIERVPKP